MINRCRPLLALMCLVALLAPLAPPARAQDGSRYENAQLGVAFDLPGGWQVDATESGLVAAAPADLAMCRKAASRRAGCDPVRDLQPAWITDGSAPEAAAGDGRRCDARSAARRVGQRDQRLPGGSDAPTTG